MYFTDPIADMLTRMRNALNAKHKSVSVPNSKTKAAIAEVLLQEGFISSYKVESDGNHSNIVIEFKFGPNGEKVINGLKRISKPGLRIYANVDELPKVINGLGIAIISTNKGLMTDKQARNANVGGEVLAYVW